MFGARRPPAHALGIALAMLLPAWGTSTPAAAAVTAPAKGKKGKKPKKAKAESVTEETAEETPAETAPTDDTDEPIVDDADPDAPPNETDDVDPDAPTPDETPADSDIESPVAEAPTRIDAEKVAGLEAEARAVQDELFKARARVSTLASKLFRAKIDLELRSNLERFYEVSDLVISVDGAPVVTQASGIPTAADELFVLYAAPGAHEVSFSAELVARRDTTYKLRIQQTFTVLVPEDSTVSTKLSVRETGNMWRFAKRGRGHSNVRATLRARAKPNERGRRAKGKVSVSGQPSSRVPSRPGGRG